MGCAGVRIDAMMCNSAVTACANAAEWKAALQVVASMSSLEVEPNVITLSAVLSACEAGARWEESLAFMWSMHRARLSPDGMNAGSVISASLRVRGRSAALRILEDLQGVWLSREAGVPIASADSRVLSDSGLSILYAGPGLVAVAKPMGISTEDSSQ